jgi:hypothetical protein
MCGLPSYSLGQRLQAGCYEHISETIGFHRSTNSWTDEWQLSKKESASWNKLFTLMRLEVKLVIIFAKCDLNYAHKIASKQGRFLCIPFLLRLFSNLYWSVTNVLSGVQLGFPFWGKDKGIGRGIVIWREWIEERHTEGCSSQRVRYSSYCGADQIGKNILDRKFISHGGQIVCILLTKIWKLETTW